MQSLQFVAPGRVEWREHPAPRITGPGQALVRPVAASICDIDLPVLDGTAPWQGPFALGHEAVAEITDLADDVTGLAVGELVAVTWHINCGACANCRRGLTAHCTTVTPNAMYGLPVGGHWGGLFDDVVAVPFAQAMLTPIPPGLTSADAVSLGDNLTLGYQLVEHHIRGGRRRILILGAAAVGINLVAFAVALGADDVVYVDDAPAHRDVAAQLGASAVTGPPDRQLGAFDLIVDASFNPSWLRRAIRLGVPEAVVECIGGYFDDLTLPALAMYTNGITFHTGRANTGPHVSAALELLRRGAVAPAVWSTPHEWSDIADVLQQPPLKPVFSRAPLVRTEQPA